MSAAKSPPSAPRWPRPDVLPPADDKLVIVEASAGTGKTYFLEHRVVDLVLAGAPLDQILVVTFTDKATAELRTRIRDLVDRISRAGDTVDGRFAGTNDPLAGVTAWTIDATARERLRAALAAFDYAPIFTIHGFCQRVLVEDAFAARRLFEQTRIADEIAFDDTFAAVLREQLAREPEHAELLGAYLETGKSVDDLHELLLRCARADAPVRRSIDLTTMPSLVAAVRAELGDRAALDRLVAALPLAGQDKRNVPRWITEVGDEIARLPADPHPARALGVLGAARESAGKIAAKCDGYGANIPARAHAAVAAIRRLAALPGVDTAVAAQFLPLVLVRLGTDKAERGLFDYGDMLRLVAQALDGDRGGALAQRLRTRQPWALIDEFQDTDPTQWKIFRTVWMHPDARGLTIVGDPKQAIYSFRGADVRTYLDACAAMTAAGARRVPLTVNRRSTAPLVDAVNALLVGDRFTPLLHGSISYDEPVTAGGGVTCAGARPPITVLELGEGRPDPQRLALSDAIGVEIEQLRADPPAWSIAGREPAPFALRYVMVLTRTNSEASEIATALRGRGLPCALVESDRLFDTREAADLAAVLAAIAAPRDRSARLRALRSRFFDVPWHDLAAVVDAPDHHPAIARLHEWAALAGRRAYEQLFRRLVEDSRFVERALVLGGGERAITNTWHVIELLLEEVARARSDLHELVGRLRGWIADQAQRTDERDTQRAETDADAIRILTVHKAKGLEAPYVFLYGMAGQSPPTNVRTIRDPDGRAVIVGSHDDDDKKRWTLEQAEENQRLGYVALTRAQIRLYIPSYPKPFSTSMYVAIQRCVSALTRQPMLPAMRAHLEVVPLDANAPRPGDAPVDALATFDAPSPPVVVPLAPITGARAGLALISYTRLAHGHDAAAIVAAIAHAPGASLAIADELLADEIAADATGGRGTPATASASVADDELPPGTASGLLLHDVLEAVDVAGARATTDVDAWAADPRVAAALADAARARGVDARYLPHAARVVHRTLTAPLDLGDGVQLPPLAAATAFARELEFEYPFPLPVSPADSRRGPPRGLVKGFIDALVAWDDELWVVDYKSDVLPAGDHDAAARRVDERYSIQARLYGLAARALAGRRRFAGMLFAFVRYGIVVPMRVDDDQLAAWADWLARVEAA